jgi:hypothetical protein
MGAKGAIGWPLLQANLALLLLLRPLLWRHCQQQEGQ